MHGLDFNCAEVCVHGLCGKACAAGLADIDCGPGTSCQNGKCVQKCVTSENCAASQMCIQGYCSMDCSVNTYSTPTRTVD